MLDIETQKTYSEVNEIPVIPISFEQNSELSALSWEAVDNRLTFEETKKKYQKSQKVMLQKILILRTQSKLLILLKDTVIFMQ